MRRVRRASAQRNESVNPHTHTEQFTELVSELYAEGQRASQALGVGILEPVLSGRFVAESATGHLDRMLDIAEELTALLAA